MFAGLPWIPLKLKSHPGDTISPRSSPCVGSRGTQSNKFRPAVKNEALKLKITFLTSLFI